MLVSGEHQALAGGGALTRTGPGSAALGILSPLLPSVGQEQSSWPLNCASVWGAGVASGGPTCSQCLILKYEQIDKAYQTFEESI